MICGRYCTPRGLYPETQFAVFIRVFHSHSANQEQGTVVSKDVSFFHEYECIMVVRNVGKYSANYTESLEYYGNATGIT